VKKFFLFSFLGLLVALVAAVLIVPGLIDWNDYKAEITARAKALTGRDLVIGGNIQVTVFPAPALVAHDVRLANLKGAAGPYMARLKTLEIRIAPGPLLSGQVQVETIKLVRPEIALEILADGRGNWEFSPPGGSASQAARGASATLGQSGGAGGPFGQAGGDSGSGAIVRLDNFSIEDGTLTFRDAAKGAEERLTGINATVAAASLRGPFESAGRLVVRGIPLTYDATVEKIVQGRTLPLSVNIGSAPDGSKLRITGTVVGLQDKPSFKGHIKAEGKSLAGLIRDVAAGGPLPGLLAQPFSAEGVVVASAKSADIKDLILRLGEAKAAGGVSLKLDGKIKAVSTLQVDHVDLDKWLSLPAYQPKAPAKTTARSANQEQSATPRGKASIALDGGAKTRPNKAGGPSGFQLPKDVDGTLKISIDAVTYRGAVIHKARAGAELTNGVLSVNQFSAELPGGSEVAVFGFVTAEGGQPRFEGEVDASASDSREILRWLGLPPPDVPAGRLRRVTASAKVVATAKEIKASGLKVQFDSSRLDGGVTVALREPLAFGANLTLDRINLDAYMPKAAAAKNLGRKSQAQAPAPGAKAAATAKTAATATMKAAAGDKNWLPDLGLLRAFDANLRVRVKTMVYKGIPVKDLILDGTLFDNQLTVRRASIAEAGGVSATLQGAIKGLGGVPDLKGVRLDLRANNLQKVFTLLGTPPPDALKRIGAIEFKGNADGSILKPGVNLEIKAAGGRLAAAGKLTLLPIVGSADLQISVRHKDAARLLRILGAAYKPRGRIGGLDVAARLKAGLGDVALEGLKGALGSLTVNGNLGLRFGGTRLKLSADLVTGPVAIDTFLPARRTAALTPGPAGAGYTPAAWGAAPAARLPSLMVRTAVRGSQGRWSTEPIDLTALRDFDADIKLKAPLVSFEGYRLETADLALNLNNGILRADRVKGRLFDGEIEGDAIVDVKTVPGLEAAFKVTGLSVGEAARTVAEKGAAKGRMNLDVKLATRGRNMAEMISALGGGGKVALLQVDVKGAGQGSALAGALGLVSGLSRVTGALGGAKGKGKGLADITGTFRMERGIARSQDLKLVSNLGRGQAAGTVDLPRWTIDIKGQVEMSPDILTQILVRKAGGPQLIPFAVWGALDKPNVKVDTSKLPAGGVALPVPGVDKLLKKKGVGDLLQGILGGGGSRGPEPAPAPTQAAPQPAPDGTLPPPPPTTEKKRKLRPEDLLKGIFNIR